MRSGVEGPAVSCEWLRKLTLVGGPLKPSFGLSGAVPPWAVKHGTAVAAEGHEVSPPGRLESFRPPEHKATLRRERPHLSLRVAQTRFWLVRVLPLHYLLFKLGNCFYFFLVIYSLFVQHVFYKLGLTLAMRFRNRIDTCQEFLAAGSRGPLADENLGFRVPAPCGFFSQGAGGSIRASRSPENRALPKSCQ